MSAEERITKLEAQNEELQKLVAALKSELELTEKRVKEIEAAQGGGKGKGKGDKKKGGDKKKEGEKKDKKGGKGGDKKEEKKDDRAKDIKAAIKEGGKKGQDLSGMSDLGGMSYFTVAMEKCKGDWDLLQEAMNGANKEVDENGDDRKGGAGGLAKCFMSCDEKNFVLFLYHAPTKVQEEKQLPLKEWVDCMMSDVGVLGEILEITDTTCKAIAKQNKEKELFPLKQRDAAINASFKLLRSKNLIPEDDSDDEDMGAMYENADIEW